MAAESRPAVALLLQGHLARWVGHPDQGQRKGGPLPSVWLPWVSLPLGACGHISLSVGGDADPRPDPPPSSLSWEGRDWNTRAAAQEWGGWLGQGPPPLALPSRSACTGAQSRARQGPSLSKPALGAGMPSPRPWPCRPRPSGGLRTPGHSLVHGEAHQAPAEALGPLLLQGLAPQEGRGGLELAGEGQACLQGAVVRPQVCMPVPVACVEGAPWAQRPLGRTPQPSRIPASRPRAGVLGEG